MTRAIVASLVAALVGGGVALGQPALANAGASGVAVPTVFISQLIPSSDPEHVQGTTGTTMRRAVQSRLANAGDGGVEIRSFPGSAVSYQYNAIGYRVADGMLYGVVTSGDLNRQLVRITTDGVASVVGAVADLPQSGTYAAGAFGEGEYADSFFVKTNSAGSAIQVIDVTERRRVRTFTPSPNFTAIDFTWADGYLWGVDVSGGTRTLVRLDVSTGATTQIPAGDIFPSSDSSGYGAAWRYGNGNLAFSSNGSGNITQIRVNNPSATTPTITHISTIAGPSTSSNDGASTPSAPTDLQVVVQPPAPAEPGAPIEWVVDVHNVGDTGSSGGTISYPVPDGVTDVVLPDGCTETAGIVQCVIGQLLPGEDDTYEFSGTAPADPSVSTTVPITVVSNEEDLNPQEVTLTIEAATRELTTSGVGTAPQRIATGYPAGVTLTIAGPEGPVTSLAVTGGTYAVDGRDLTFAPTLGFVGTAPQVGWTATASGGSADGTYTATVLPPAPPVAGDHTSTGVGTAEQSTTLPAVPVGGAVTLVHEGASVTEVVVPQTGTYTLVAGGPSGPVVTFAPVLGFAGQAPAVAYRLSDAYDQHADGTYTPTVTLPAGPTAAPVTSTGVGTAHQSPALPVPVPEGGSVELLGTDGQPATQVVTVAGTARDLGDGVFRFEPVLGFVGDAAPVAYRVVDAYGQVAPSTYTATVLAPDAPLPTPGSSEGVGTAEQAWEVPVPDGGTVTLVAPDGSETDTVVVPGQGTYRWDEDSGTVRFEPELGFAGEADPVTVRVTDAYDQSTDVTYTPTVVPPAGPTAADHTSTGVGTAEQSTTLPTVPDGGSVTLVHDDVAVTEVVVPGTGTYTLVTGGPHGPVVTFAPELGFAGPAPAVTYRLTDAYDQPAEGSYTPTVTLPAAPTADSVTSTGTGTAHQTPAVPVPVPDGGRITLVDADGTETDAVVVPGQGTYTVDENVVRFEPGLGFAGEAEPVTVRVTDAYEQSTDVTYTATVLPPAPPVAGDHTSTGVGTAEQSTTLPAVPVGGAVTLVHEGASVTEVVVPQTGTYTLVAGGPSGPVVTFAPVLGFAGQAPAVAYRLSDAYDQHADGTYTPTVTLPAGPTAAPVTSTGVGTVHQSPALPVPVPQNGSVQLLDADGEPVGQVVTAAGTARDLGDGAFRFEPVLGFVGEASVAYRVVDAYGQVAESTYTATVVAPDAPGTPAGTSAGVGTADQAWEVPVPDGGTVTLVGPDGEPTDTVVVPGQGTYTWDEDSGTVRFEPELGFDGEADPVTVRVTDAYDQSTDVTYTPTVVPPAGPVAPDLTSTGVGTTPQDVTVPVPLQGTLTLLDGDEPVTTLTTAAGIWSVDGDRLVLLPAPGVAGDATVTYRVTDAYGQTATAVWTATVLAPPGPEVAPGTSTGTGTAVQTHTVAVPAGGSVSLADADGEPTTTVVVPGQGTYVLDPETGVITFTPELGFSGTADGVQVLVSDEYGTTTTTTYTPHVVLPAAPVAPELSSTGPEGGSQTPSTQVPVPDGGSVTLLDDEGRPTDVVVTDEGTYVLDPATGTITFTPADGFTGQATGVRYRVTDAWGQFTDGTYTPYVTATPAEPGEPEPTPTPTPAPRDAETTTVVTRTLARTGSALLPLAALASMLVLGGAVLRRAARER